MLTLDEAELHFTALYGDPEPYMGQLVRVFIGEDTLCPGFQLVDGKLSPIVLALFEKALALKVPHNVFTAWMVTPLPGKNYPRPVDALHYQARLLTALEAFAANRP